MRYIGTLSRLARAGAAGAARSASARVVMNAAIAPMARRSLIVAASAFALATTAQPTLAKPVDSDGSWAVAPSGGFSDAYFSGYEKTASGLEYKVVAEGYGVKPKAGQKIKAHYAGYLTSGKKFDSSYDRKSPLAFEVGIGRVIKGWDEALLDMQVGEKRVLRIPSKLAYGSRGAGGVIPPGVQQPAVRPPIAHNLSQIVVPRVCRCNPCVLCRARDARCVLEHSVALLRKLDS